MARSRPKGLRLSAIAVVVPVFNKRRFLERCLGSVLDAAAAAPDVSVLVLDNGSTDGSFELAESLCRGRARVERAPNLTVAGVRNRGAAATTGPLLSFLDCDCVVPRDYFTSLRDVLSQPGIDATGCRVDYPDDGPWVERVWHRMHRGSSEGFRAYLNSGNFAVRREAFDKVGGFDAAMITGEDAELGQRLVDHGYRIWESQRLRVVHVDNPTTLGAFYRKEIWHALGMFGTVRLTSIDRPTAMMAMHFILLLTAAGFLVFGGAAPGWRLLAALGLAFTVPVLTCIYRMLDGRRLVPLLPAAMLYQVYYLARLRAAFSIGWRRLFPAPADAR